MIRIALFYLHRLRADSWRRRAQAAMAEARAQFVKNRLYAQRAERHDSRARALFPPPSTGPPEPHDPAAGDDATAQHDGP